MSNVNYLFFGFASEYVLNPLYKHMQNLGHQCVEIDLFQTDKARAIIQSLKNKKVVFVNSAHLFFDKVNFATSYQYDGDVISPLEIIDYLKPIKSIYIPHDLSQLFHSSENAWLNMFDHLLVPRTFHSPLVTPEKVLNVGWIKCAQAMTPVSAENSRAVGFAFSDFEYHRRIGPEKTYECWQKILDRGVPVKLPFWQGSDEFEAYFRSKNVNIYPATASLNEFINANGVILCNGASSVNSEAAFSGRKIINILYNGYTESMQREAIGMLPNIEYLTIAECAQYIDAVRQDGSYHKELTAPQIKPFDFKSTVELLTSHF